MSKDNIRFGLNEKHRIIQIAIDSNDEDHTDTNKTAEEENKKDYKSIVHRLGPTFFSSLDITHRPIAPFINRGSKIPRSLRQKSLDKLTGQHLAYTATQTDLEQAPSPVAADEGLRNHAISLAQRQEQELYDACASKTTYSMMAARANAYEWIQTKEKEEKEEKYLQRDKIQHDETEKESRNIKRHKNESGVYLEKNNNNLKEADLQWDKNKETTSQVNKKLVLAAIEANTHCMKSLTVEERVIVLNKCIEKISRYQSENEVDMKKSAVEKLVSEYVAYIIKNRK